MEIQLFDTLSGKKESLEEHSKTLRLFVCGPTVNDVSHIGHGRTYLVFDALVKFLKAAGRPVLYLQNITDVDDKIIARAKKDGVTSKSVAEKFLKEYKRDMRCLGIDSVSKYAEATKFIPQIVRQVKKLILKGFAYEIPEDGYYFDVSKFADYGKLSRRTVAQAEDSVSRIDDGIKKKNRGDFALWKFSKPDEPKWKTSIGEGRPGWHIEDTAISERFFGPQYDLHGGGMDLKFPHHEAEIAQQEAASSKKPFVKIWLHTGALTINGTKMSKSLGNFLTIQDFLAKYSAEVLRLMVLSFHYRTPFDYSDDVADENSKKWSGILEFVSKLRVSRKAQRKDSEILASDLKKRFLTPLCDDFNTSLALAELLKFISEVQPRIWTLSRGEAKRIEAQVLEVLKILGFRVKLPRIPTKIVKLAKNREKSRGSKQFAQSDALRKRINALGYGLDDTPLGPFLWPKESS
ncbi:MAG: cysteinyl-tRNA synthetase [Parcubacteria group bacterium Gr01-1014_20]|nr:MAG: cysteinyl-tRNA synthetase [Parcubacteria group bacterium Gr01-1014_20]